MGRDKALLPFRGNTLVQFVAQVVVRAAGSAVLVGDPERYGGLGYPVIEDRYPGEGPLGGILTALAHTTADWNLILACDMPGLSEEFLIEILDRAVQSGGDVLLPSGPTGTPEPLCAVYHRRVLATMENEFVAGERRVTAAVAGLHTIHIAMREAAPFQNVNTPDDWASYGAK